MANDNKIYKGSGGNPLYKSSGRLNIQELAAVLYALGEI